MRNSHHCSSHLARWIELFLCRCKRSFPLHSHADVGDFFILSGAVEVLRHDSTGCHWVEAKAGDFIDIPSNERHAWRNRSNEPIVSLMILMRKMGSFFRKLAGLLPTLSNR
ncbi:MAG: cupin domain-containing protein [Chloroflexi bacterium]|nr:cupin domain-containing protein [Chloroflexota bacterium]